MASISLAFEILARDRASSTLKHVGDSTDKTAGKVHNLGSKFAGLGKAAALGVGAAAVGAIALGKSFVDAAIESQKVTKQTEAVIKSMGGVSGVTADQVAKLSTKLSLQSGIDDELIQSGENVLLTFGKVQNKVGKGNNVFDRATEAALNMSVALGTDMQGATIQVGKALNDPIKGITALSRAGVSFTQKQKDQIKWMVATGDQLGAQKLILGELEKQFGGSAKAQATAGDRLKVVWGNLQEQLGNRLLPIIETLADWLGKVLPPVLDALGGFFQPVIDQVGVFWNALTTGKSEDEGTWIEGVAFRVRDVLETLGGWIQAGMDQIGLFWGALTTGFTEDEGTPIEGIALGIRDAFDALKKWWDDNGDTIKKSVGDALGHLADVLTTVGRALRDDVVPKFQEWGEWLVKDGPASEFAILGLATAMGLYASSAVIAAGATILTIAPYVLAAAAIGTLAWATRKFVDDHLPGLSKGLQFLVDWVLKPLLTVIDAVNDALQTMMDLLDRLPKFAKIPGTDKEFGLNEMLAGTPLGPLVGFLGRASGGPVSAGSPYIVGEQGPEWFVPKSSGSIIPNGVGGGNEVHLHVVQMPGEDQVSAGMRALRHHQMVQEAVGSR